MKKYIIEFLGTFFLMLVILSTYNYLAIGAALAIIIWITSIFEEKYIVPSLNPAVTFVFYYIGKIPANDILPFITAEILGALMAIPIVKYFQRIK